MVKLTHMNIFSIILSNIAFLLATTILAVGVLLLYNKMPLAWFMENGANKDAVDHRLQHHPSPRIKNTLEKVLFCFGLVLFSFVFFLQYGYSLMLICNVIPLFFLAMILVSDLKTGIIPDQFVFGLIFSSLFWITADIAILLSEGQPIYIAATDRILAALCGGAILFFIGKIGSFILKQDAMGMGDVKLIFACGLIVNFAGIFWIIILSFMIALIPSILGIINKKSRHQERVDPPSNELNPLSKAESGVFASNQLPFAPFIVTAVLMYLIFPVEFTWLASWYGGL